MRRDSSTLARSEAALRPLALAFFAAGLLAGFAGLAASAPACWFAGSPLAIGTSSTGAARATDAALATETHATDIAICLVWCACALAWVLLSASNVLYLARHRTTTIGMMPVSVFSLAPAALSALLVPLPLTARAICVLVLAGSSLVAAVFVRWFCKLRKVYAHVPAPDEDAVLIVCGGAVRDGQPRPTLARRLDGTARLLRESPLRRAVLSGGQLAHEDGTEAEAMWRYLVVRGIPQGQLVREPHARNTRENVELSLARIEQLGLLGQRCVITSDYHLYRAVAEGKKLGCDLLPVVTPTPWSGRLQQWCREVLTILARG